MITEDYVGFETAKLLKDKGFDEPCNNRYYEKHSGFELGLDPGYTNSEWEDWYKVMGVRNYSAPTLQRATKWLQEALNILVIPNYEYECDDTPWCYKIFLLEEGGKPQRVPIKGVSYDKDNNPTEHTVGYRDYERSYEDYSTKEEAIEEGIKYCLENLI